MKLRTLILMIAALGVLAYLAWNRQDKPSVASRDADKLLSLDLNKIARFTIEAESGTVAVARKEDGWVVESRGNYPADFDKIVEQLRRLADLPQGEIIRGGTSDLKEFGLDPAAKAGDSAVITLYDVAGAKLAALGVGSLRGGGDEMRIPDSQYMRVDDGAVMLVPETMNTWSAEPSSWINRNLLSFSRDDVASASVKRADGEAFDVVQSSPGQFTINPAPGSNETLNADSARMVVGQLDNLQIIDVYTGTVADAAITDASPAYHATLTNGLTCAVTLGTGTNIPAGRVARIEIGTTDTASKETMELAAKEKARIEPFLYVLAEGTCQNMTPIRSAMMTAPPPASAGN